MDSDVLQATPDGALLADWIEQWGVSKSAAYRSNADCRRMNEGASTAQTYCLRSERKFTMVLMTP